MNVYSLICANENAETADWIVRSFPVIKVVIMSVLAVLALLMIILVVMQKSDQNGISAVTGQTDTFYNRNKKTTLQGKIKVITIIVASTMMALCLIFLVINQIYEGTI